MKIYCVQCKTEINARLTNGKKIYPHRPDLFSLPFWKCDTCGNFVGCHYKSKDKTKPLGNIPTKELRSARGHIHQILDPLWKNGDFSRGKLYALISEELGYSYHTAEIKSIEDARIVYKTIRNIAKQNKKGGKCEV